MQTDTPRSYAAALSPQQALQAPSQPKTPTPSAAKRRRRDHSASPASRGSPDRFIAGASRQKYFYDSRSDYSTPSPTKSAVGDSSPAQRFDKTLADALGLDASQGSVHLYAQRTKQSAALRETALDWTVSPSPPRSPNRLGPLELKPYRILDAPQISEDFYSSIIAWSSGSQLAVGIHAEVHLWSERSGHKQISGIAIEGEDVRVYAPVTALAYSHNNKWIAIGRRDGTLHVHAKLDRVKHAEVLLGGDIGCLVFRPRLSGSPEDEYLLVGGYDGNIYHYAITVLAERAVCRLLGTSQGAHKEQVTGLAWSTDGKQFATGSNDNTSCVFEAQDLQVPRHRFRFEAAVKAIAFCPWMNDLLAAGGGANDKTVRFYNTKTGHVVQKLDVQAQVTSLHWSSEYKEFAATYGYCAYATAATGSGSPGRISPCRRAAVYAYPSLKCLVTINLPKVEHRATYAVNSLTRTAATATSTHDATMTGTAPILRVRGGEDLIVAATDETIRFYKVWACDRARHHPTLGLGGGKVVQDDDLGGGLDGLGLR